MVPEVTEGRADGKVRLSRGLMKLVRRAADDLGLSISGFIRLCVIAKLQELGYLDAETLSRLQRGEEGAEAEVIEA